MEDFMFSPDALQALHRVEEQAKDRRVVFVSGNFNILHPGHLRLLRFAKECGDYLVVGVLDAYCSGAYMPEALRLEGVQAIHWVDHAFILRDPLDIFLERLKPAFVVKGREHETQQNPEEAVLRRHGGKLLFGSGEISFSSMDLLRQEWRELDVSTISRPDDFFERHAITRESLRRVLERMRSLRVCVVGDLIVDEYITCDPLGMSQEDPTIVVTPVQSERFVGGAGIVAAHVHGLGADVGFFTVTGRDEPADFARASLERSGVRVHAYSDESRPTTLKQRFRASQKTLLRVSHVRQHDIAQEIRARLLGDLESCMKEADLLLFSDFNYGCLPQPLVAEIQSKCAKWGIRMAADSQSSSQMGDISRFSGMQLVTPTEREARLAMQDFDSGLVVLADNLRRKGGSEHAIITLGAEGILIQSSVESCRGFPTDRLPALNRAPKDPAGAGDSLFAGTSMALASGASIWEAAYLGSLAAACQVGRIGNIPLSQEEILLEINR